MRLYYFTGAHYALSNIALRRLKISRFSDLNDPFELLGANLANKSHRKPFREAKDEINGSTGLLCFSRSWKNPLLWGHYAERHTGICLGFDVTDELLAPVIYARRLLKISLDRRHAKPRLRSAQVNKLMRTKFADWKYEDEVRLFVELDPKTIESGMYFYSFSPHITLLEIILGPRCELPITAVRDVVKQFAPRVDVLKARIAFETFSVVKHKIASR